ncbi:serine/threonine-protein kinase [Streptomyces seoulensis]
MEELRADDPRRIGAYRLLARLGAGGMGQVYLARSDRGRTVAVKLVRCEPARREEFRARFRQEVRAARRVGGHWTAPVLDADTEAEVPWVATGYVAGPSLQQVVGHDHGALPERSVRILAAGLAAALQDIHAAGLVHRDLKPSNVLVTLDGPRVIDFGIARALESVADGGLTRTGALIGSPGFMAPEQVRGDRVGPACDVFCLGSVLAYAATGALPFGGADSGAHVLMYRIAEGEPDLSSLPEGIADLVRDCLRKDPAARPGLAEIIGRTGARDTVSDGRLRDPWLPSALVAQLGRHAVRLLDTEHPVETAGPSGTALLPAPPVTPPAPARPPATPLSVPSGGAPAGPVPPCGPGAVPPPYPPPRRGNGRATAALIAVALVVALGAGGSVYAVMRDGAGDATTGGPHPSPTATDDSRGSEGSDAADGSHPATPSPAPSSPADGVVPSGYLGTWLGSVENRYGPNPRRLTISQGEVGDTVLRLVADGTGQEGDSYHCVFEARLTQPPTGQGPLKIGPSTVTAGGDSTSCAPGAASEVTLLPDGGLRRANLSSGDEVTYTKE